MARYRPLIVWLIILTVILGGGYIVDKKVPNQHLPWRALNVEAPTGFATRAQLMRMSVSPSSVCQAAAIGADNLNSIPANPREANTPCGWKVARLVYGSEAATLKPGEASMQCPLAIGTYIWMREIDRLATEHLGSGLNNIHHYGTYSCRRQNGNSSGRWSEHAFANAWDIASFELQDGRIISVLKDWDGDKDRQRFLRGVRDEACNIFRVTLSPDYNAAHADHFHVDMGPSRSCR